MSNHVITNQEFHWQGRHDVEDGPLGKRVHHVIKQMQVDQLQPYHNAVSLLGFCSDAGVARNKGRIGARRAPDLIRRALANMAWHKQSALIDLAMSSVVMICSEVRNSVLT